MEGIDATGWVQSAHRGGTASPSLGGGAVPSRPPLQPKQIWRTFVFTIFPMGRLRVRGLAQKHMMCTVTKEARVARLQEILARRGCGAANLQEWIRVQGGASSKQEAVHCCGSNTKSSAECGCKKLGGAKLNGDEPMKPLHMNIIRYSLASIITHM